MEARDWIEWGAFALPGLWGLASGVVLSFSKPETNKAKIAWFLGLAFFVLLATTINFFNERLARAANISIETGNERSFLLDGPHSKFARVRVSNKSWQEAICRLYLTDLTRAGDSTPILKDDKILMAASNTGGEGYKEHLIGPGSYYLFDVAYIVSDKDQLLIQSLGDQFLSIDNAPLPRGNYRFTVGTDGKNCTSAPFQFTLRYDGWPNLSFATK